MDQLFLIIDCQNYGQLYVLEYPFSEEAFEYLRKKFQRFKSKSSPKKPQNAKFPSPLPQEELTSRFLAYNPENCIHDIIVENIHYISCSAWINNPTKKKTYDVLYLEIFTLVFAKHKSIIFKDKHRDNTLQRIYMNLEAYSHFFTVAEKKKHFLGSELYKIIDFYEHFFSKANINNCTYSNFLSQLPVNNKVFNILQVIYRVINKQHLPKGLIDSLEFNYFTTINSPYDYVNNINNSNNEVKSVYMMNKSILALRPHKLQEYLKVCIDINPQLLLFLRSASPFKSIWSVTKECRLDIGLVFDFVLKLQSWGLISIIYSIHEHSLFEVNPHWNCEIDKDDTHLITFNQFSFVEAFANSRPGTTILQFFTKCFEGKMDQKQFKKGLVNCLENEYLIQSTSYVLVKLPFKYKYDYECTILNEAKEFVDFDKNVELLLEDKNVVGSEREKAGDEGYCYEDFVNDIKDNKEDYEMLKRITPFLYERMNVEDISYFTNLNITTMLDMLNRYPYMFDIVVLPVK